MNRKSYNNWKCDICGETFGTRAILYAHLKEEKRNGKQIIKVCPFCGRTCRGNFGYSNHVSVCKKNPNRDIEKSKKLSAIQLRTTSPEKRRKLSEKTVFNNFWKYRSKNPIIYTSPIAGTIKLDSKWELIVAKKLDLLGVTWYRPRIRLPYLDANGVEHGYFPDFFVKDYHCFLEVKSSFIANYQSSADKVKYVKDHYKFVKWLETEDECKNFTLDELGYAGTPEKEEENKKDLEIFLKKLEETKANNKFLQAEKIKRQKEKNMEKRKQKYGEGRSDNNFTKLSENEWERRKLLLDKYDKTVWGWIMTMSKETGLTPRQIQKTCDHFNINWRTNRISC